MRLLRFLALFLFAPAALAVSGCGSPLLPGQIETVVNTPVAGSTVIDERAYYATEALYNVPAHAYVTAHQNGQITPQMRDTIRPILQDAYTVLQAARAAYRLGDAATFAQKREALTHLRDRLSPLIPGLAPRTAGG